jgi:hypothetical protein
MARLGSSAALVGGGVLILGAVGDIFNPPHPNVIRYSDFGTRRDLLDSHLSPSGE